MGLDSVWEVWELNSWWSSALPEQEFWECWELWELLGIVGILTIPGMLGIP